MGTTALDRLKARYDAEERTCRQCGYVDREGGWQVETTGSRVLYRHICPSCGAIDRRELRL